MHKDIADVLLTQLERLRLHFDKMDEDVVLIKVNCAEMKNSLESILEILKDYKTLPLEMLVVKTRVNILTTLILGLSLTLGSQLVKTYF